MPAMAAVQRTTFFTRPLQDALIIPRRSPKFTSVVGVVARVAVVASIIIAGGLYGGT